MAGSVDKGKRGEQNDASILIPMYYTEVLGNYVKEHSGIGRPVAASGKDDGPGHEHEDYKHHKLQITMLLLPRALTLSISR